MPKVRVQILHRLIAISRKLYLPINYSAVFFILLREIRRKSVMRRLVFPLKSVSDLFFLRIATPRSQRALRYAFDALERAARETYRVPEEAAALA